MRARDQPDYEQLRLILERELGRKVTLEEAKGTGKYLIGVYEVLLSDEITNATMKVDTTNHTNKTIAS